ncbi:hypothetical protein N7478_007869 [Penicillium angulare]|uniref:uncharacterized protein n=1 Tax=Penicillium angulare TaxID=116970 RepID=UPI0025400D9B|nr:uncharacterized protein N7478_007869 [Penicillium angulare]KAJ5272744.1 hypothetical protein N7478_007869 [Penicillium angulare]
MQDPFLTRTGEQCHHQQDNGKTGEKIDIMITAISTILKLTLQIVLDIVREYNMMLLTIEIQISPDTDNYSTKRDERGTNSREYERATNKHYRKNQTKQAAVPQARSGISVWGVTKDSPAQEEIDKFPKLHAHSPVLYMAPRTLRSGQR